ncbi:hypothetical protein RJT34_30202 [Clitoria ternatea]|uniref:Uncharacterized protein n=1 Tax=Clitoria ternatea TaxID=43366 RepID=A0AAN9I1S2_CLITE
MFLFFFACYFDNAFILNIIDQRSSGNPKRNLVEIHQEVQKERETSLEPTSLQEVAKGIRSRTTDKEDVNQKEKEAVTDQFSAESKMDFKSSNPTTSLPTLPEDNQCSPYPTKTSLLRIPTLSLANSAP